VAPAGTGRHRPAQAAHPDRTLGAVVLDRVGQQVDDHLTEAHPIGMDHRVACVATRIHDADPLLGGQGGDQRQALVDDRIQRHAAHRQLQVPGLDPAQVDQVVHQRQQMLPGPLDLAGVVAGGLRHMGIRAQQLREAQDRVQRRAQFVAHAGQEGALGPVRPLGLLLGEQQRGFGPRPVGDVDPEHIDRGTGGVGAGPDDMGHLEINRATLARGRIAAYADRGLATPRTCHLLQIGLIALLVQHIPHVPPDDVGHPEAQQLRQAFIGIGIDTLRIHDSDIAGKRIHQRLLGPVAVAQ
jgi:hypothetical protein